MSNKYICFDVLVQKHMATVGLTAELAGTGCVEQTLLDLEEICRTQVAVCLFPAWRRSHAYQNPLQSILVGCLDLRSRGLPCATVGLLVGSDLEGSAEDLKDCFGWLLHDDFLLASSSFFEYEMRLQRIVERLTWEESPHQTQLTCGPLEFDCRTLTATIYGDHLVLTKKEIEILLFLMKHVDETVTREELAMQVWHRGNPPPGFNGLLNGHLCRLREKLGNQGARAMLKCLRGEGVVLSSTAVPRARLLRPTSISTQGNAVREIEQARVTA
jgi:Transcriptional regulatory protein, C terminal